MFDTQLLLFAIKHFVGLAEAIFGDFSNS